MLAFTWVALRFIHFTALMLVFGCALYGAWLAPVSVRRLMMRRFLRLQRHAATWSFISATLMLAIQGGLMGSGWRDVVSTAVWGAVLQTQFGGVWLWREYSNDIPSLGKDAFGMESKETLFTSCACITKGQEQAITANMNNLRFSFMLAKVIKKKISKILFWELFLI